MKIFFLCTSCFFMVALSGCSSFDWDGGRDGPSSGYGFFDGAVGGQYSHGSHGDGGHKH